MQIQKAIRILSLNRSPSTEVPYIVSGYLSSNKILFSNKVETSA